MLADNPLPESIVPENITGISTTNPVVFVLTVIRSVAATVAVAVLDIVVGALARLNT